MILAIDFDGTIVEHRFPDIGNPLPFAFVTLRHLQKSHTLVLWTCRTGKELQEAIDFCAQHGLIFDAVNQNPACMPFATSPKIYADVYIDDRNVFAGRMDWDLIQRYITAKSLHHDPGFCLSHPRHQEA